MLISLVLFYLYRKCNQMEIIQFEDKCLSHFSYALISNNEMALIDPERNPQPYYELAKSRQARIVAVFETHPHADFVSSHAEINQTLGATIYVSSLLGASYPHKSFDDGDVVKIGEVTLQSLHTPGHSPDSISILVNDENGIPKAVFTGDTLFIGDCGRPDLRETAGNITSKRHDLAKNMYHSLRDKLMTLPDDVIVYPAHGAGSLCGKGLSSSNSSTIGVEKASNWCLKESTEEDFVNELLSNQPFVPKYFTNSVELNKKGAPSYQDSIDNISIHHYSKDKPLQGLVIDTRSANQFKTGHLPSAINLMEGGKFETWLGSIVSPNEKFFLLSDNEEALHKLISRAAKIGYESQMEAGIIYNETSGESENSFDEKQFRDHLEDFTVLDVRNNNEVTAHQIFPNAVTIPLPELRERVAEIPTEKPIVVHCAAGYRSAAGQSIVQSFVGNKVPVIDMGESINHFK